MITAIILAAGESKRMGQPKMLLPWGDGVVLSHAIHIYREAGVEDILVVTGGARQQVESAIQYLKVKTIYNKDFSNGEMLSSIQYGIRALTLQTQAVLIGLGDQPQVQAGSVRMICDAYRDTKSEIVAPSFQMRRGHPWLVARSLWGELLELETPQSPRDFLHAHNANIQYVNVDDAGVLADLDTPEDYQRSRP
ncbi:MAG TPA: nucleotidyltransferase family protein [Anaerolineales bacterium]|nr:nucleotidyltransferase family protein [Anaerolineales bacterium]